MVSLSESISMNTQMFLPQSHATLPVATERFDNKPEKRL